MMRQPWDCAQPDEWLPRSLRLCWGGDSSGDSSGGGFGDAGFSAATGGGDWGSAGSFDASGFNAGGDLGAWAGTAYDASTSGTGAGAGGDWGSFGATNYSGMNAPNPIFTDIAGPNPGVTTGGGDWGSAGTFSAAGMGGGPGGSLFGSSGGGGLYGGSGGGLFGDYGGGPGGFTGDSGYTGGGGGGGRGGGPFGGFTGSIGTLGASNTGRGSERSGGDRSFSDTVGSAGGRGAGPASAGRITSDAPTRSEAEVESVVSADPVADPEGIDPGGSQFGAPTTSEPDTPAPEQAAPEASRGDAQSQPTASTRGDRGADPEGIDPGGSQYGVFGPQSLSYQQATQQLSDLTQTSLQPADVNWGSVFEAPSQAPQDQGKWSDLPGVYYTGISNLLSNYADPRGWVDTPAWAQNTPTVWEAMQPGGQLSAVGKAYDFLSNLPNTLNPNNWVTPSGLHATAFDQQSRGEQGKAGRQDSFDSRFGFDPNTDTTNWGAVFEAPTPDTTDWSSVFEGGPTGTDWGAVFEGAAPALDPRSSIEAFIEGGRQTDFADENAPGGRAEAFIPGGRETNFDYNTAPAPQDQPQETQPQADQPVDVELVPSTELPANTPNPLANDPSAQPDTTPWGSVFEGAAPSVPITLEAIANAVRGAETDLLGGQPGSQAFIPGGRQTDFQYASPQQAQLGLLDMPPGAPGREASIPGGRETDFNYPTSSTAAPNPAEHGEGNPGGEGDPDQGSSVPVAPPAPPEPGGVTAADRAARGPNAQPEAPNVQAARQYLLGTANPGDTMNRQGPDVAIARLEPNFAVRLAAAIRDARANGLPNASVFSAFRAPAFGANPGYAAVSQHGRGVAVDMSGIGRPGSREAQLWYDIATRNGLFNPYGPNHRAEWNHYQAVPQTGRQTANRLGPNPLNPPANMTPTWDRVGVRPVAPADTQLAGVPLPRGRPGGIDTGIQPGAEQYAGQPLAPQPPTEITNLPPQRDVEPPAPRPQADIPIDIPVQTLVPPGRGRLDPTVQTQNALNLIKQSTAKLTTSSGQAEFNAAGVVAAKDLAKAGVPLAMARSLMTQSAYQGAERVGYGPSATLWSLYKGYIDSGIEAALQGYHPAKPGEVQGPPAPADLVAPGKRSEFGSFVIPVAGGRDVGAPPAVEPGQLPGRAEWESSGPGGWGSNLPGPMDYPVDPRSGALSGQVYNPDRNNPSRVFDPDIFQGEQQQQQEYQQNLDPRGWQQATLNFLQNFNPISTAEARGGKSQAGNLAAPRADPSVIQGRLSSVRADIVNELQTNLGLRNTLDLIVTGEVGSQGKAAVLGFLETAMNKVAAEASREGRTPTGRDLLNYLNDRSYFPDTWGKIDSGKVRGGALTDDLLGAIGAGSNTTQLSTGNSSASSQGSRFGGNPTNATIGKEHYGVENYAHHAAWYNAMGAPSSGRGIGSDYAVGPYDAPAVGAMPPQDAAPGMRGLAKGGRVDDDEPVVVGEQGPEVFVPDRPGTVWPHVPQPGLKSANVDRWPKLPTPDYPGRYGGVEREIKRQTRAAQDIVPGLMDMIDSGRLRLTPNWNQMINDPSLIALGRSRIEDRRAYSYDYPY